MTSSQALFPYSSDPLYPLGAGPHVHIEVVGPVDAFGALEGLPEFGGEVDWASVPLPRKPSGQAEYTFVLWSEFAPAQLRELLTTGERTAILVLARQGDRVPGAVDGRRIARLVSDVSLVETICRLVPALILPLVYRSPICLDYADLEFALGLGGNVQIFERQAHGDGHAIIQKVVDDASTALNAQQDDDVRAVVLQSRTAIFRYADRIGEIINETTKSKDCLHLMAAFHRKDIKTIVSILTVTRDNLEVSLPGNREPL